MLENKGEPSIVQRTLIRPPEGRIGPLTDAERRSIIAASPFSGKYETVEEPRERRGDAGAARSQAAAAKEAEASRRRQLDRHHLRRHQGPDRAPAPGHGRDDRARAAALVRAHGSVSMIRSIIMKTIRGRFALTASIRLGVRDASACARRGSIGVPLMKTHCAGSLRRRSACGADRCRFRGLGAAPRAGTERRRQGPRSDSRPIAHAVMRSAWTTRASTRRRLPFRDVVTRYPPEDLAEALAEGISLGPSRTCRNSCSSRRRSRRSSPISARWRRLRATAN